MFPPIPLSSPPSHHVIHPFTFTTSTTTTSDNDNTGGLWLYVAGVCALYGTILSLVSITMHLRNYRRPDAQRLIIRILWMVPIYGISSYISLLSKHLSDYIDTLRDLYEAFVIYTFFNLLVTYLGGERELLVLMEDRPRGRHLWPVNYISPYPLDLSDPSTFLWIRRCILQFVIVKPILAVGIFVLKLTNAYEEGTITWESPYLWISFFYNISVTLTMYSLVLFYSMTKSDLKPYRPVPKFLCVKAIIFFSFWQSLGISILVAIGAIPSYTNEETKGLASWIQNCLICLEIPAFAYGHLRAFSWTDYDPSRIVMAAKLPFWHAVKDATGFKDILLDAYHTVLGTHFKAYSTLSEREVFERGEEDGEGSFLIGGEKRKYSRQWIAKGVVPSRRMHLEEERDWNRGRGRDRGNGSGGLEINGARQRTPSPTRRASSSPTPSSPSSPVRINDMILPPDVYSISFPSPSSSPRTEEVYEYTKRYLPYGDVGYVAVMDESEERAAKYKRMLFAYQRRGEEEEDGDEESDAVVVPVKMDEGSGGKKEKKSKKNKKKTKQGKSSVPTGTSATVAYPPKDASLIDIDIQEDQI